MNLVKYPSISISNILKMYVPKTVYFEVGIKDLILNLVNSDTVVTAGIQYLFMFNLIITYLEVFSVLR